MNVIHIALKEIKSATREPRTLLFMLAFPVVLMLILGTALSNAFSNVTFVGNLTLLYEDVSGQPQLTQAWQSFVQAIGEQGVEATAAADGQDGRERVQEGDYAAFVELRADGMAFYGSSWQSIESNILQGMLTAFADRYNLAAAAVATDPAKAEAILAAANADADAAFVRETALDPDKSPDSIGYYAIAMSTMIALYASISGSHLYRRERTAHTDVRLLAAPIGKGEIFAGKVIGCTFINLLCVLVVVLFSKFVFQADWGEHFGLALLVLASLVALAVSLGLGIGSIGRGDSARSIIMIFTQVASFVGGAYFPLAAGIGSFIGIVSYLSPLRWANTSLIGMIYLGDTGSVWPTIALNLGLAAALLFVSAFIMRKREAL